MTAAPDAVAAWCRRPGTLRRVLSRPAGVVGAVLAVAVAVSVLAGPVLIGHDANAPDFGATLAPPSAQHWAGTDRFGRDQLVRLLEGGRSSLGAALVALSAAVAVGALLGVAAGLAGGVVDVVVSRVVDVALAFPSIVLALAVVGALGPGFGNLVLALALTQWASFARLARSTVLAARARADVVAARLAGVSRTRVAAGHLLPGTLAQLLTVATLELGGMIVALAGLSFLGLGAQPPAAEWGAMLSDARATFTVAPWLLLGPVASVLLVVTAATLLGDALRDALDPAHPSASPRSPRSTSRMCPRVRIAG